LDYRAQTPWPWVFIYTSLNLHIIMVVHATYNCFVHKSKCLSHILSSFEKGILINFTCLLITIWRFSYLYRKWIGSLLKEILPFFTQNISSISLYAQILSHKVTCKDENFAKQIHLNWMKYKKVQILDNFILESTKDIWYPDINRKRHNGFPVITLVLLDLLLSMSSVCRHNGFPVITLVLLDLLLSMSY
jgi:hypothetical protein